MKKIIAAATIIITLAAALTGCGNKENSSSAVETTQASTTQEVTTQEPTTQEPTTTAPQTSEESESEVPTTVHMEYYTRQNADGEIETVPIKAPEEYGNGWLQHSDSYVSTGEDGMPVIVHSR